jgi:hypothetical protein
VTEPASPDEGIDAEEGLTEAMWSEDGDVDFLQKFLQPYITYVTSITNIYHKYISHISH